MGKETKKGVGGEWQGTKTLEEEAQGTFGKWRTLKQLKSGVESPGGGKDGHLSKQAGACSKRAWTTLQGVWPSPVGMEFQVS